MFPNRFNDFFLDKIVKIRKGISSSISSNSLQTLAFPIKGFLEHVAVSRIKAHVDANNLWQKNQSAYNSVGIVYRYRNIY